MTTVDLRSLATSAEVSDCLAADGYIADEDLATAVLLALRMRRPLLLEGEAGVGKTELARTLARLSGAELIRLQCHEGIDAAQAVYEWDHARQLMHLRAVEAAAHMAAPSDAGPGPAPTDAEALEDELFSERYLVARPLLRAMRSSGGPPPVLLVDEVDRADDEFEAFLLEALSDHAVTVPELGTFRATTPPVVVLTSNRTRDVHDALRRRCLYHWLDHPEFDREVRIVESRAPGVPPELASEVAAMAGRLRELGLYKPPGVAETIDWAESLTLLGSERLDAASAEASLGVVLKYREDRERVLAAGVGALVEEAVDRVGH